jgi:hypothetical protein
VQITLAIIVFRIAVWLVMTAIRGMWRGRNPRVVRVTPDHRRIGRAG